MKLLLELLLVTVAFSKRAQVYTCSGCKLNRLPALRQFIFDDVAGITSYREVSVKFISGHNPELVIYDDHGVVEETLDMTQISVAELERIMRSRGFTKKSSEL